MVKRLIFGCVLLLAGVIGFVGWAIACSGVGYYSEVTTYFYGSNLVVSLLFIVMFSAGLVLSVFELMRDGKKK